MFIKIEVDGKENFYAFKKKPVVTIGRSQTSDIQIINDGVSRNHIEIWEDNGDYYIYDKGSTNGTYINDEELEVDKRYPFNSFFPVRLGFDVFVSLLDDVSISQLEIMNQNKKKKLQDNLDKFTDTTTLKNLDSQISNSKRSKRIKGKKDKLKKNEQLNFNSVKILIFLALVGFYFYQDILKFLRPPQVFEKEIVEEVKIENSPQVNEKKVINFQKIVTADKCLNPKHTRICNKFKSVKDRNYYEGIVEIDGTIYIVIDPQSSIEFFKEKAPRYSDAEREYALLRLARNSKFKNQIIPNGRFDKNIDIDVYRFDSNKINSYSNEYYFMAVASEIYFGDFGGELLNPNYSKVEFIFYQIINDQYKFKSNYPLIPEKFNFNYKQQEDFIKQLKFALFNNDNEGISRYLEYKVKRN